MGNEARPDLHRMLRHAYSRGRSFSRVANDLGRALELVLPVFRQQTGERRRFKLQGPLPAASALEYAWIQERKKAMKAEKIPHEKTQAKEYLVGFFLDDNSIPGRVVEIYEPGEPPRLPGLGEFKYAHKIKLTDKQLEGALILAEAVGFILSAPSR